MQMTYTVIAGLSVCVLSVTGLSKAHDTGKHASISDPGNQEQGERHARGGGGSWVVAVVPNRPCQAVIGRLLQATCDKLSRDITFIIFLSCCWGWDMQVMSKRVPYITQLHGSSAATATPLGGALSGDTATARVTGVVRCVCTTAAGQTTSWGGTASHICRCHSQFDLLSVQVAAGMLNSPSFSLWSGMPCPTPPKTTPNVMCALAPLHVRPQDANRCRVHVVQSQPSRRRHIPGAGAAELPCFRPRPLQPEPPAAYFRSERRFADNSYGHRHKPL